MLQLLCYFFHQEAGSCAFPLNLGGSVTHRIQWVMSCNSEAQLEKAMQCSHCSLGMLTLGEASHHVWKSHHPETSMLDRLLMSTLVDRQLSLQMAALQVYAGSEEQRQATIPFPSPNLWLTGSMGLIKFLFHTTSFWRGLVRSSNY